MEEARGRYRVTRHGRFLIGRRLLFEEGWRIYRATPGPELPHPKGKNDRPFRVLQPDGTLYDVFLAPSENDVWGALCRELDPGPRQR